MFIMIRPEKFEKSHCGSILREDISWEEGQPYAKRTLVSSQARSRTK